MSHDDNVFPALLRYWRGARGLSQLDLSGASGVSARHISFLETGRANPSQEMVLRLASTMDLALRDQNALLLSAGFAEMFRGTADGAFEPIVQRALEIMMRHHEPFPLLVFDRHYDLVTANDATARLLKLLLGERSQQERNLMRLLFDPDLLRPFVVGWERIARALLNRMQRELLHRRRDAGLSALISSLCAYREVPEDWRAPDLTTPSVASLEIQFEFEGQRFGFLTTLTVFQAPQNVSLEELRIESYFPLDEATEQLCRALVGA
ncbi:MAG: helix-turn-helix transcriptional regulator [Nannocystaceae bacterium]|nr:helix-turn-helix transcriptional regulator [Nannocystaceae bacterium]